MKQRCGLKVHTYTHKSAKRSTSSHQSQAKRTVNNRGSFIAFIPLMKEKNTCYIVRSLVLDTSTLSPRCRRSTQRIKCIQKLCAPVACVLLLGNVFSRCGFLVGVIAGTRISIRLVVTKGVLDEEVVIVGHFVLGQVGWSFASLRGIKFHEFPLGPH